MQKERGDHINIDFEEIKKIHEAVKNASDKYTVKSFKPWESAGSKEFITIVLAKKD